MNDTQSDDLTFRVYETWSNRDALRRELIAQFAKAGHADVFCKGLNDRQEMGVFYVVSPRELPLCETRRQWANA